MARIYLQRNQNSFEFVKVKFQNHVSVSDPKIKLIVNACKSINNTPQCYEKNSNFSTKYYLPLDKIEYNFLSTFQKKSLRNKIKYNKQKTIQVALRAKSLIFVTIIT